MKRSERSTKPTFRQTDDPGLALFDPVQNRQFTLETPSRVRPTPVDEGTFTFPVDRAVEIAAERLVLPYVVTVHVRNGDGDFVCEAEHYAYEELPEREYYVEIHAPMKIYLRVGSGMTVASSTDRMEFDFGDETAVQVGARSYHERPAFTVTTTEDPADVMAAVSTFGSALKTTSPERSFPTLRGHPPRLELGESLDVPSGLSRPDTGVRIELPPERWRAYVAAPLAYYLGAEVVPGETPRILTDDGVEYPLTAEDGFDAEVERVLKRTLFLDCLARTEGLYPVDLHERRAAGLEDELSFADLYEASLSERLASYLSVPFERIEEHVPTWRLAVYATPEARNVELLPYLVDELAVVRRAETDARRRERASIPSYVDDFVRSTGIRRGATNEEPYVTLPETDALERAWLGTGRPFGANKLLHSAFDNRSEDRTEDDIGIDVVCNDPAMREEYDGSLYGQRDELPFDVNVHDDLSTSELERLLASRTDFLHYIGHVERGGFVCSDGTLDAASIERCRVETFLLNGCNSYEQGRTLVERGSVGGIVTHGEVGNSGAIVVGRFVARLLNAGFSLRSALSIVQDRRIVANQYTVIGDGGVEVAQSESGTPDLCRVRTLGTDEFAVEMTTYPTAERGIGSLYIPYLGDGDSNYLSGGRMPEQRVTAIELVNFCGLEQFPVLVDGEFYWSTQISFEKISD